MRPRCSRRIAAPDQTGRQRINASAKRARCFHAACVEPSRSWRVPAPSGRGMNGRRPDRVRVRKDGRGPAACDTPGVEAFSEEATVSVATRATASEGAGPEGPPGLRRNVLALGADFSTFMLGMAFATPATLIPAFAERLGAPNLLIGAIPALMTAGWMLPAIFAANYTQSLTRKLPFILKYTVFERISYPLLGLAAIYLAPTHPTLTLVLLVLLLGVMTFTGGLLTPAWLDLVARAVPVTLRGRFFAISTSVGTGLGLGGAAGVSYLLDRYGYPVGYGLCFLAATAFFVLSFVFLALAREPAGPASAGSLPTAAYLRRLPRLVRADPNLARFLGARALDVTGGMASGFYTVYALKELGAPDSAVGAFTLALMAAQTL